MVLVFACLIYVGIQYPARVLVCTLRSKDLNNPLKLKVLFVVITTLYVHAEKVVKLQFKTIT
jgi:hypothetical protein